LSELFGPWQSSTTPTFSKQHGSGPTLGKPFAEAGQCAAKAGVIYSIEPLAPRLTSFLYSVAETAALVSRLALPALRTMVDTSAAAHSEKETPAAPLTRWLPSSLISHVHFNDANQRGPG
jgi:D-psicose/D-tagatose/L-ribulose 3-epimerase